MRSVSQGVRGWLCCVGLGLLASLAQAEESVRPDQVVEQATQRVMAVIEEARDYHAEDPERYFQQIDQVMEDVVDYRGFARGVMGVYASKQRYQSLSSDAEREQFKSQFERFSEVFRQGLIRTYAKGLLAFNGERIEVEPVADADLQGARSVNVIQRIFNQDDSAFEVVYKMRRLSSGEWKLLNVTIEGVNLGLTYRNQFAQSVKDRNGDIDQVIEHWNATDSAQDADSATAEG